MTQFTQLYLASKWFSLDKPGPRPRTPSPGSRLHTAAAAGEKPGPRPLTPSPGSHLHTAAAAGAKALWAPRACSLGKGLGGVSCRCVGLRGRPEPGGPGSKMPGRGEGQALSAWASG